MPKQEYQLVGIVISSQHIPVYQGRLKDQGYYQLKVAITPKSRPEFFNNTIRAERFTISDDQTWADLVSSDFDNKRYRFFCHKHGFIYRLVKGKIISK